MHQMMQNVLNIIFLFRKWLNINEVGPVSE